MKQLVPILGLGMLFLGMVAICNAETNVLEKAYFSVEYPSNWTVEQQDEDRATIIMPGTEHQEIFVDLSASLKKQLLSPDEYWEKLKKLLTKDKSIVAEGNDSFAGSKWKKLVIEEKICNINVNTIVYFTIKDGVKCTIKESCPKEICSQIEPTFELIKKSFKFINK